MAMKRPLTFLFLASLLGVMIALNHHPQPQLRAGHWYGDYPEHEMMARVDADRINGCAAIGLKCPYLRALNPANVRYTPTVTYVEGSPCGQGFGLLIDRDSIYCADSNFTRAGFYVTSESLVSSEMINIHGGFYDINTTWRGVP